MTASFADHEIWHVLIASDDMKRMNVDQLDDAFRLSLVDASTLVWKAGMKTWQRLGSVAGIEDEPEESITRMAPLKTSAPPPPPRPLARPAPKPPSRAPNPFAPTNPFTAVNPFASTALHTAVTPVFASPLVAPVYTPQLTAPDPYVLPKRRVAIPSEVDFRRSSGGVRWGRWLVALVLITGGVLGAYRQNLLREGARRLGVEGKYLYGEKRAIAFINAKAPYAIKNGLTRLALLPGPNALRDSTAALRAPEPTPAAAAPVVAATEPTKPSETTKPSDGSKSEPEVKTVSLDSLPVLANDVPATPKAAPVAAAAAVAPVAKAKSSVARAEPKESKPARTKTEPARAERAEVEKPEPVAKAEPKPKAPALPPPSANDSPLKAAIRMAIAADNAKAKK